MSRHNRKNGRVNSISTEEWLHIVDLYYDEGIDVPELANRYKIEQKYIHAAIQTDKTNRKNKGMEMRTRNTKKKQQQSSTIETVEEATTEVKEVEEEKMVAATAEKKRGRIAPPDNMDEVYLKYTNKEPGYRTLIEAGNTLHVSGSTFYKWIDDYRKKLLAVSQNQEENIVEETTEEIIEEASSVEESKEEIKVEDQKEEEPQGDSRLKTTLIFNGGSSLAVGMIGGRHDLPVDKYIFDERLYSSQIVNFDWQEEQVEKFIDDEIGFTLDQSTGNYIADKDLIVYATGIQCVLCSIFKACNKKHVNLTVMHHDSKTDKYNPQEVISEYPTSCVYNKMFPETDTLETIDLSEEKVLNLKSYYNIKKREYDYKGNVTHTLEIISPYVNIINDKCYKMLPDIMASRGAKQSIDIYYSTIENGIEKDLESRFHCSNG